MDIRDLGAALGYLFSRQTVAQQNIETSYRPILHAYGRVLRAVSNKIAMSAVMFAPTTAPLWLFGATIPVLTSPHTSKSLIQADRLRQMRAALLVRGVVLPPLPKQSLSGLAIQLANDKVPTQAQANLRNASPALLALYEELLVALVAESTGTYPIILTFKNNLTDFNAVRQRIVTAESPAWGQAVIAALTPDDAFRTYLHTTLANNPKPEFGHCAESFPFMRLLRFAPPLSSLTNVGTITNIVRNSGVETRTASQGLAMVPRKMVNLNGQQITAGTVSYNTIGTFRKPCPNCTQVLILAGMTENTFNTYIRVVVTVFDPEVR